MYLALESLAVFTRATRHKIGNRFWFNGKEILQPSY
jgi:hypothetical protein